MAEEQLTFDTESSEQDMDAPSSSSRAAHHVEPSNHSYAFLVHSADTLTNNLPPNVDNKPLARQKRRRTSPEDQAILEAEYLRNPKPDKAARMEIVERVALGEKEVQIWFQNRRQSSRRKSRPLLPHEIAHYQSSHSSPFEHQSPADNGTRLLKMSPNSTLEEVTPSRRQATGKRVDREEGEDMAQLEHITSTPVPSLTRKESAAAQAPPSSQESSSGRMGYLANRRSAAPPRPTTDDASFDMVPDSQTTQPESQETPVRGLKKTSSFVRLSMTADGNAKIVTKESSSPSPPRKTPSAPPSSSAPAAFRFGQGSFTPGEPEQLTPSHTGSSLRRKPSGRSRDSRAWEFWCDKDARTELEEKADQEASGSAADAIGLIRSNSGRGILQSLTGKRESPRGELSAAKRQRLSKTPLLQRSASMQNSQPMRRIFNEKNTITPGRYKKNSSGLGIELPANDSDKENWSPERQANEDYEAEEAVGPRSVRRTMARIGRTPGRTPGRPGKVFEDFGARIPASPDEDEEVASFMGRERKSQSVSEEEELDCVQGLLSLSQGNWR